MRTRTFATLFALAGALSSSACDKKEETKGETKAEAKKDEKKAEAKADVKAEAKADAGEPAADVKAEAPAAAAAAGGTVELTKLGLRAKAPGASVGEAVLDDAVMIQGEDLTATVSLAEDDRPKTLEDAKKQAASYEPRNWKSETLADGWAVTFENEGDLGVNFFVQVRREIGGKSYWCETAASTVEEQANTLALCKTLQQ